MAPARAALVATLFILFVDLLVIGLATASAAGLVCLSALYLLGRL